MGKPYVMPPYMTGHFVAEYDTPAGKFQRVIRAAYKFTGPTVRSALKLVREQAQDYARITGSANRCTTIRILAVGVDRTHWDGPKSHPALDGQD